jgi:hypothetical protein
MSGKKGWQAKKTVRKSNLKTSDMYIGGSQSCGGKIEVWWPASGGLLYLLRK